MASSGVLLLLLERAEDFLLGILYAPDCVVCKTVRYQLISSSFCRISFVFLKSDRKRSKLEKRLWKNSVCPSAFRSKAPRTGRIRSKLHRNVQQRFARKGPEPVEFDRKCTEASFITRNRKNFSNCKTCTVETCAIQLYIRKG